MKIKIERNYSYLQTREYEYNSFWDILRDLHAIVRVILLALSW
jgi:hypothetical protein